MTTGTLEENVVQFADLLRLCCINVLCDFYDPGIDLANFNGQLWVQQKINECIDSGGYILVDVTDGPINDLSEAQDENPIMKMRFTQFYSKILYQYVMDHQECFVPFCLDNPQPDESFPFQRDSIYPIYITEFQQSFLEFKETKYLELFNVSKSDSAAMKAFLNTAPEKFQPIVALISHLTGQGHIYEFLNK